MGTSRSRRRPAVQITTPRAARLYRLVRLLETAPRERPQLLRELGIGLRTFYRETALLRRVGIRLKRDGRRYVLTTRLEQVEASLPFPDPRLTFAEMRILATMSGEVGQRLARLYQEVLALAEMSPEKPRKNRGRRTEGQ
ncbi:MAG: hypothetical protein KatS3mg108_1509 [Isosphaeraceae bacterium]|jgi:predicted DNA-binding transcriptional regulator YafY|nr:MAG: hypothetical protein KatS3mg108_1509 [Isosphaeraceae bacterium]